MQIKSRDLKEYNARTVIVADNKGGVLSQNCQTVMFFFLEYAKLDFHMSCMPF